MDINLTDIKKQYEKLKTLLDEDDLELSDEDALRCQDALQLMELRGYVRDLEVDGANLYLKMAEWDGFEDWLNEMIKEAKRLNRREWAIALVGAVVGAVISAIATYIVTVISTAG